MFMRYMQCGKDEAVRGPERDNKQDVQRPCGRREWGLLQKLTGSIVTGMLKVEGRPHKGGWRRLRYRFSLVAWDICAYHTGSGYSWKQRQLE